MNEDLDGKGYVDHGPLPLKASNQEGDSASHTSPEEKAEEPANLNPSSRSNITTSLDELSPRHRRSSSPKERRLDRKNNIDLPTTLTDRTRLRTPISRVNPDTNTPTIDSQTSLVPSKQSGSDGMAILPPLTARESRELLETHEEMQRYLKDGGGFDTRFESWEYTFDG